MRVQPLYGVPVGVAPHEHHPVAKRHQPLQDGGGLGPGRVIAGDDHQVSIRRLRLSQHGLKDRQHAVDVGQNRDRVHHRASFSPASAGGEAQPPHLAVGASAPVSDKWRLSDTGLGVHLEPRGQEAQHVRVGVGHHSVVDLPRGD